MFRFICILVKHRFRLEGCRFDYQCWQYWVRNSDTISRAREKHIFKEAEKGNESVCGCCNVKLSSYRSKAECDKESEGRLHLC